MRILLLSLILLIPACKKATIGPEFKRLEECSNRLIDADIMYDSYAKKPEIEQTIKKQLKTGISREEAVRIALMNNPQLQADFEKLGITKADLVQAGLYTNPHTTNVFRIPTRGDGVSTTQLNIESGLTGKLSDLWRVPLRTRIFEDELEIVTLHILTNILDIIEQTKSAYDTCLKTELMLENENIIFRFTKELQEEIYYRQGFGYSNEQDKFNVDAQVAKSNTAMINREKERIEAYLHLTKLLGIPPTANDILLLDTLLILPETPDPHALETHALEYRPEILIAHYTIKRFEDTLKYERASIWKDIDLGISYKRDFEKPFQGWGPELNFTIPIFDTNHAQIAKAEFELEMAKKEMRYQTIRIQEEIRLFFTQTQQYQQEITFYDAIIIPSFEKAIDYTYTFARTMQLNMLDALHSQLDLYQAESDLIDKYYNFHVSYNKLERAYGKTFNQELQLNKEIS